jgi:hypothetical protein
MREMIKKITSVLMIVICMSACSTLKDGLTIKKKSNADEFLIKKKSSLILPPEFESLPVPKKTTNESEEEIDIEGILNKKENNDNQISSKESINKNLEKTILEKIKKIDVN